MIRYYEDMTDVTSGSSSNEQNENGTRDVTMNDKDTQLFHTRTYVFIAC